MSDKPKNETMEVEFPEDLMEQLRVSAARNGISVETLVQVIIEQEYNKDMRRLMKEADAGPKQ